MSIFDFKAKNLFYNGSSLVFKILKYFINSLNLVLVIFLTILKRDFNKYQIKKDAVRKTCMISIYLFFF